MADGFAAKRYNALKGDRDPFLRRARRCASLTKVATFREEGDGGYTDHAVPWSSFGAFAAGTLANKVSLSLFPAGVAWTRISPSQVVINQLLGSLPEAEVGEIKAEIEKTLSQIEKQFVVVIEEDGDRVILHDAIEHMVIGGNYGIGHFDDGRIRGIPLARYVTRRDNAGRLVEFCVEDPMEWKTLPDDVKSAAKEAGFTPPKEEDTGKPPTINVYTYGSLSNDGKRYTVMQEVEGVEVSGSKAEYLPEALPFDFLRWRVLEDEDYGRGYVEDFEGDLQALDGLYQMVQEGGAAVARFLWLVRPGGVTSKEQLLRARNGAVITGDQNDISALRAEKGGDLSFVLQIVDRIEQRLARIFLIPVQRDAERVTAEEIRIVARELEDQLGTAYSNQVVSFQAPYARKKLKAAWRNKKVTKVPERAVKVTIITGAAALGRMAEIQLLDNLLLGGAQVLGSVPPNTINENVYMMKRAAALGVDSAGVVLTEEQRAARIEADQQAALQQQVAPEVVRQGGQIVQNQQEAQIAKEQQDG